MAKSGFSRWWRVKIEAASAEWWKNRAQFVSMLLAVSVAIVTAILMMVTVKSVIVDKPRLGAFQQRFYQMADAYFLSELASDDVGAGLEVLFNVLDREYDGDPSMYGYSCLLEDYIAECIVEGTPANTDIIPILQGLLAQERIEEPYVKLPADTRRLFLNLESSIRTGDTETALENVNDIADQIRTTNSTILRLRSQNSAMMALAIAGVILTIVFGIGTIAGLRRRMKRAPSASDD